MKYDVVIIGAGPAGLFCAYTASMRGRSVALIDHAKYPGRKLLASGGGRCNFTNVEIAPERYASQNQHFVKSALARFTTAEFLDLMDKRRVAYLLEEDTGKYFCRDSAVQFLDMLLDMANSAGRVSMLMGRRPAEIKRAESGYAITLGADRIECASLVIATGGVSYPGLGATGLGHEIARSFGIRVIPTRPALVPLTLGRQDRAHFGDLSGISCRATIVTADRSFTGNLLFTHRGISGPAVLNASLYWESGSSIAIEFFTGRNLRATLESKRSSGMELVNVLATMIPKRLAVALCNHIASNKPMKQYTHDELSRIIESLAAITITPSGTEGYKLAEVTAGGVDTAAISSKTMECSKAPGLHFIGEVLDVTGELGGYNIHWAMASAKAAGQNM